MTATTKITWKFRRAKGYKKWVSADQRAWVAVKLSEPGVVHYGMEGDYIGTLRTTPKDAMEMIEETQDS